MGITLGGALCIISDAWGGRATDRQITREENIPKRVAESRQGDNEHSASKFHIYVHFTLSQGNAQLLFTCRILGSLHEESIYRQEKHAE